VVNDIPADGDFTHLASGVRYRIERQSGGALLRFDGAEIHGQRRLDYFVGSGTVGHSYLYLLEGFLYESPVSWYAGTGWDVSPGYEKDDHPLLTRPIGTDCLQCHASRLQPVAGTVNGFRAPPFVEGGVSCERCHGPGDEHAAGRGRMLDPAKLPADRRDSVCAQCHLAGEARVARPGTSYRPGDRLSDSTVVFVWAGEPDFKVTSHFETLAQSRCKQASGDRLWCGTCHDPHRSPSETERVAYYRARCQSCHEAAQCARGRDCAGCHMPKTAVRDVQHSIYTDHTIRKPGPRKAVAARERTLVPFGSEAGEREYGLAYAAQPGFQKQAILHLERAAPADGEAMAHLAFLYESAGDPARAMPLYEKALQLDPGQVAAAVNLGNLHARRNDERRAIPLWRQALERSPGLEAVRLSLAVAEYRTGDTTAAEHSLEKLLELNPGAAAARRLLNQMRSRR
jgi:hypothetical protein